MPNNPINVAENLVADKGSMTISTKLFKYVLIALVSGTLSILGFAYGLYTKSESNRKADKLEILSKMKELNEKAVTPNTQLNITQDKDIVRLYERVDSRANVNAGYERPPVSSTPPPIDF